MKIGDLVDWKGSTKGPYKIVEVPENHRGLMTSERVWLESTKDSINSGWMYKHELTLLKKRYKVKV